MMKVFISVCLFWVALFPLPGAAQQSAEYRNNVGDIPFDSATDKPDFYVCDEIRALPYNTRCGMLIEGERYRVVQYFAENYKLPAMEGQTGYITIRFMVNCKGQTDRFRLVGMDSDFNPATFNEDISSTLLALTKAITGWKTQPSRRILHTGGLPSAAESSPPANYDYYQYILFKLKNGLICEILP